MPAAATAVSAPGKVLLAGGYTVLDPACRGLVFALSARIHVIASPANGDAADGRIVVRSPQFLDAEWEYQITAGSDGRGLTTVQTNSTPANPFVMTTLRYVLSYLAPAAIPPTTITILADNDYYSQPPPPIPRFNRLNVPISTAHKTGLGSSAALVTSLTACLLSHFSSFSPQTQTHILHNLAQAAHCAAQGKVGSGFDVAAATYGSCEYQRFPAGPLSSLPDIDSPTFTPALQALATTHWDMTATPLLLPPSLGLAMGDVRCGSSTPGMVRAVLAWRAGPATTASDAIWARLDARNRALLAAITDLQGGATTTTTTLTADTQADIAQKIRDVRTSVRELASGSGVPIEPPSQTALLDAATEAVDGVLGGVVPGAGGFDAVCFLYVNEGNTGERLREFLGSYQLADGVVRPLEVREDRQGWRVEDAAAYSAYLG